MSAIFAFIWLCTDLEMVILPFVYCTLRGMAIDRNQLEESLELICSMAPLLPQIHLFVKGIEITGRSF